MWTILGSDGRPYGPVSADQVRQWIRDGRANGQTLAQAQGAAEWKPLGSLPEFAEWCAAVAIPPLVTGPPDLRKSKLVAGLLGVLLGGLGLHRFYLGYIGIGIAQIVVSFATCGLGALWGLIEGILILVGSSITTDAEGRPLKEQ
jgi:TM2 domain-containing membrane protein YozV